MSNDHKPCPFCGSPTTAKWDPLTMKPISMTAQWDPVTMKAIPMTAGEDQCNKEEKEVLEAAARRAWAAWKAWPLASGLMASSDAELTNIKVSFPSYIVEEGQELARLQYSLIAGVAQYVGTAKFEVIFPNRKDSNHGRTVAICNWVRRAL